VLRSATQEQEERGEWRETRRLISPQAFVPGNNKDIVNKEEAFKGAGDRAGQAMCMQSSPVHNCETGLYL